MPPAVVPTNDSVVVQHMLDTAAYEVVLNDHYSINVPLYVRRSGLMLRGRGTLQATDKDFRLLNIQSSVVRVCDLTFAGVQSDSGDFKQTSKREAAIHASYVEGLRIEGVKLYSWGFDGIRLDKVQGFHIGECLIDRTGYAAIIGYSVHDGSIVGNRRIKTVVGRPGRPYAYGIALTSEDDPDDQQPSNVVVRDNIVRDIPLWEGFDLHGGVKIEFINNAAYNCRTLVATGKHSVSRIAPQHVSIIGNYGESSVSNDGWAGIVVESDWRVPGHPQGPGFGEPATGRIEGNELHGFGDPNKPNLGAIHVYGSDALQVIANIIHGGLPNGLFLYHNNRGFLAAGNISIRPAGYTGPKRLCGIKCGEYNSGTIGVNRFDGYAPADKIYITPNAGNEVEQ